MVLPVLKIFGVQNFHLIEGFQNQEHFIAELERLKAYKSISVEKQEECDMVKRVFSRFATKLTSLEIQSSVISELSNLELISEEPGLDSKDFIGFWTNISKHQHDGFYITRHFFFRV